MSSPLVGAWEIASDLYRGFMVYTGSHYAHNLVEKDRRSFQRFEPTEAEGAEAYRTTRSGSGTYTISGSSLTLDHQANRIPNASAEVFEFTLDGDELTIKHSQTGATYTFRKVS